MMGRSSALSVLLLLVLSGSAVQAQSTAEAFFHEAAQQYVEGNVQAARHTVERGLEVAPSDPRLQALRKKLRQRKGRRGGGRSSQAGQQDRQSGQQSGGDQPQDDRSGTARPDAKTQSGRNRSSDRAPRARRPSASSGKGAGNRGERRAEGGPLGRSRPRNALSQAQARQLLRALETQEKKLLREIRVRSAEHGSVGKDW